jgi:hypothetical protein
MTRIDAEILSQMENKERRLKSHAQQIRRADIAGHYDRLIERKSHSVVPPLVEFRGLPIIRALQDREDASPFPSDSAILPRKAGQNTTSAEVRVKTLTANRRYDQQRPQPMG